MLVLMSLDINMNVITTMNNSMNIIEPPGGVGGGADCPLMPQGGITHRLNVVTHLYNWAKVSNMQALHANLMDDDGKTWQHTQPMPMRGSPCVVTEANALSFIEKMESKNRIFLFSDSERAVPGDWGYLASVRPGVPPEGIMAEVDAWLRQYPDAWLAVDMRVGVIPPAVPGLEDTLRTFPRVVIVIVSDDTRDHTWPRWEYPL